MPPQCNYPNLDYEPLDDDHAKFARLVAQLSDAPLAQFAGLFDELVDHTQAHFSREEDLMRRSNFPAAAEHQDEHARILGALAQFKKRIDRGLVSFGRAFVAETLPSWLPLHVSTMDSALVHHLNSER